MPFENSVNFNVEQSSNLTTNHNYLAPIFFRLSMDKLKFPNVQYTLQTVLLPDVSINAASLQTPHRRLGLAGEKVEYGTIDVSFLIDEDMLNYQEIYDWMIGSATQADDKDTKKERDITLSILSSHNNVTREIQFINAFPIALSSLPFDVTVTDVQYLTAVASFEFAYFKLR